VLSNLLAILDPRAVFLTGSFAAFVMAALVIVQVRTVQPYGKPLVLQAFAQIIIGIALYFSAVSIYDFSSAFTLRVFAPAAVGYGLAMASLLSMYQPNIPLRIVAGGVALILLGYIIWPSGFSARIWNNAVQLALSIATVLLLIRARDELAPKARITAISLCIFFGLGVIPRLLYIITPGPDLNMPGGLLASPSFRFGVLILAAMPVLMYACVVGTIQARIAAKLRQSVHHDMLTGAHSRRFLFEKGDEILHSQVMRRHTPENSRSGATLLMIDVDYFKKFNDTWGHLVGDRVLRHCVDLIQQVVRKTDAIVCRYGGEEFCVLVPEMTLEHARALSERIRLRIADQPFEHQGELLSITVSIGVAQQPEQSTLAALIHVADERLYMAKRSGRNRVVDSTNVFDPASRGLATQHYQAEAAASTK
jgi:diguanylate cyclase (GGDEF)-like protein